MLRQLTWAGGVVLGLAIGFGFEVSDWWLGSLAALLVLLVEGE